MIKTQNFIERAIQIHGDKYNYSKVIYKNSRTEVCIICPEHGEFWQTPSSHLRGYNCPKCANLKKGGKRWDTDKFINESKKVHGNKYDYSQVNYINGSSKVTIICKEHGEFTQTPTNHLSGQGCPKCAGRNLNTEEIISLFKKKHGDYYDYSRVVYEGMHKKVCIICPEHGEFWQTPSKHILGQKCKKCSAKERGLFRRMNTQQFIAMAQKVHGDKYDYSNVNYRTSHDKIEIKCPKHGIFLQFPYDHLQGHGCPYCTNNYSIGEMEIYTYLCNKLGEDKIVLRDRTILNGKEIDIFIPSKNIGIEYNGLYWHSEANGKGKWYHYNKTEECNKLGIKLIQIFEDEYLANKELVLTKLEYLLKMEKMCPKIMGRKCIIREITNDVAKEFLDKNHIQRYSNTTISIGAFYQGILIGVMCFNKTGELNKWILNRFATDNKYICQGVGGKLFHFFIKRYNPLTIKSFADRRWTIDKENNFYEKIGFKLVEVQTPDYRYIKVNNPKERVHKFNLRKKSLHRHYNLPMDMTEKEMVEKIGYAKIWDCGLYKYEWKKQP